MYVWAKGVKDVLSNSQVHSSTSRVHISQYLLNHFFNWYSESSVNAEMGFIIKKCKMHIIVLFE